VNSELASLQEEAALVKRQDVLRCYFVSVILQFPNPDKTHIAQISIMIYSRANSRISPIKHSRYCMYHIL
jgi:hypothetical protein